MHAWDLFSFCEYLREYILTGGVCKCNTYISQYICQYPYRWLQIQHGFKNFKFNIFVFFELNLNAWKLKVDLSLVYSFFNLTFFLGALMIFVTRCAWALPQWPTLWSVHPGIPRYFPVWLTDGTTLPAAPEKTFLQFAR